MGITKQLTERLAMLELKQRKQRQKQERLPVYYGWAKINRGQRREALMVIFLNESPGPRVGKDGQDGVTKWMFPVYKRWQTPDEMKDGQGSIRTYSTYNIFMDDRHIKGSLEAALDENFAADSKNVSLKERTEIRSRLRESYLNNHHGYREPIRQLELSFYEQECN